MSKTVGGGDEGRGCLQRFLCVLEYNGRPLNDGQQSNWCGLVNAMTIMGSRPGRTGHQADHLYQGVVQLVNFDSIPNWTWSSIGAKVSQHHSVISIPQFTSVIIQQP